MPKALQPAPGLYVDPQRGTGPSMFQNTFSALSFITVGDKYGERPPIKGTRFAGKQFSTTFPKKGTVSDAYFTKEFKVMGGEYAASQPQRYLKTQPRDARKKGFLSGDASKRDEALNTTMADILASTFNKETRSQAAAQERARNALEAAGYTFPNQAPKAGSSSSSKRDQGRSQTSLGLSRSKTAAAAMMDDVYDEGRAGPEFLFDVGRGAETSFCSRSKKERWYEPRVHACRTTWSQGDHVVQGVDKRLGSTAVHLSSMTIGVGAREMQERNRKTHNPVEYEASPHSRRSVLQQQQNRPCGALLPPFTFTSITAAGAPGSTLLL